MFRNLRIAWRLGRFDGAAAQDVRDDGGAVLRSFLAMPIAFMIGSLSSDASVAALGEFAEEPGPAHIEIGAFVLSWLFQLVLAAEAARLFGREAAFGRYLVAQNWATVVQQFILSFGIAAFYYGGAPDSLAHFWAFCAGFWMLAYEWFVGRAVLAITVPQAAALLGVKLVAGLTVYALRTEYLA